MQQKLTMPVLVLWADKDKPMGPQLLRGTEQCVDRLRVVTVENCSHWIQEDR